MDLTKLTNQELYKKCRIYGENARLWLQKFAGLLPEVNRRRLYKEKGFGSIYEFAAKLAGMNHEQVSRVLGLEVHLQDKPLLHGLLEAGAVSIHKLDRIVSHVTSENEEFWMEQVKVLPKRALDTLIRDQKTEFKDSLKLDAAPGRHLKLLPEIEAQLVELQNKGIDINALLLDFLNQREREIAQEKEELAVELAVELTAERTGENSHTSKAPRYIKSKIRKMLTKEFGTKCAIETCQKQARIIHHTNRFGLAKTHNPYFLAPLCEEHHVIAHSIDLKFHEKRASSTWAISKETPIINSS